MQVASEYVYDGPIIEYIFSYLVLFSPVVAFFFFQVCLQTCVELRTLMLVLSIKWLCASLDAEARCNSPLEKIN